MAAIPRCTRRRVNHMSPKYACIASGRTQPSLDDIRRTPAACAALPIRASASILLNQRLCLCESLLDWLVMDFAAAPRFHSPARKPVKKTPKTILKVSLDYFPSLPNTEVATSVLGTEHFRHKHK